VRLRQRPSRVGTFDMSPGHVRSVSRVASYSTKARAFCPAPGELPLYAYGVLRRALRGRRLLVRWGRPGGAP
jgi:hypothetical protein